jgi:sporulation protein YlmC with PRC-barrel domain
MELPISRLSGRKVLDITGRELGRVGQLLVDTESWAISSIQLKLHRRTAKALGLHWSFFRVPTLDLPTGLVMAASDAIILRAALDELQPLAASEEPFALHAAAAH